MPDHRPNEALSRRYKIWGWIFAGCGTMLGIAGVVVVLFLLLFARGRSELTPVVEDFLDLLDRGDHLMAYDSIGDQWKSTDTFEEFQEFFLLVHDALGSYESIRMASVHYQKNLGSPTEARIVVAAKFEKGPATSRVTLQAYGEDWKLEGMRFESDVLESKLTCPFCSTVNKYNSHHCSNCGAKLEKPSSEQTDRQRGAT